MFLLKKQVSRNINGLLLLTRPRPYLLITRNSLLWKKKVTRVIKIYRNQRIAFSLVARESIHYRTRVWSLAVFPEPVVASATMWKGSMAFLLQECQARPWPLKESVE